MVERSINDGRMLERNETSERRINNSRKFKQWSQSDTSVKVNYATKILERSIADVGKLLRKSSMVVECLNVAGTVLEQSNNARRSVTSWWRNIRQLEWSLTVRVALMMLEMQEKTLESSIDDARKLKRKCWSVASLKTEEKIFKRSISGCGWQTLPVRTQFLWASAPRSCSPPPLLPLFISTSLPLLSF